MNLISFKIKEPKILEEHRERYEKLLKLYQLLQIVKDEWFKTPSDNKTSKLVCLVDVEIFKNLYLMESNIIRPINITEKQLSDCFRKPKNIDVDWSFIKQSAMEIFRSL